MIVSYLGALGFVMTPCALLFGLALLAADTFRDARTPAGAPRAHRAPFDHAESRPAPRPAPRIREDELLDEPDDRPRPRAQEEVARAAA